MPKFVVYEVWTKARIVDAVDEHEAYRTGDPNMAPAQEHGLNLCNWHVVPVGLRETRLTDAERTVGKFSKTA